MDKRLEYLYDQIEEELDDAHGYIKKAMKCKGEHLEMANTLTRLSAEELQHAQVLVATAAQDISHLEKSGMQEAVVFHKWLHKRFENRMAEIKKLHEEYHKM